MQISSNQRGSGEDIGRWNGGSRLIANHILGPAIRRVAFGSILFVLLVGCAPAALPSPPPVPPSDLSNEAEPPPQQQQEPPAPVWPATPGHYRMARHEALRIYRDHRTTFFCGCEFTQAKRIIPESCGYQARRDSVRAKRISWAFVVSPRRFGQERSCWTRPEEFDACREENGEPISERACCREVDPEFRAMEADLQNIRPVVAELAMDRFDAPFGEVPGEPRAYGSCDFELEEGVGEPRPSTRGDIARTFFYFEDVWGMELTPDERELFEAWNRADPPDDWETQRGQRILEIQKVGRPFAGRRDAQEEEATETRQMVR